MKKQILTCFLIQLCLVGSTLKAQSKVAESPPGTDLVYQPGFPGQEDGSPSARLGEGTLYFELSKSQDLDSLTLRFWDHLISERMNVTPGTKKMVPGAEGNMFEGSMKFQVFTSPFPKTDTHGYFSVNSGRDKLIRQWIYFPEDRVRIRADLAAGVLLFGGPDAAFYRLQYEVDRAFKEDQFNANPILFSSNREFYRSDSLSETLWQQSRTRREDLYVQMQLISNAEEGWDELEKYISSNWLEHPATGILDRYSTLLSAERLNLVEAAIKGQFLFTAINKADLAWPAIQQDSEKMAKLKEWVDGFYLQDQEYSHPLLAQAVFQFSLMEAQATQTPIEQVYRELPNPLREEVIAFYVLDNFNRMENRLPGIISKNLPLLQSEWIKSRFENLLANVRDPFSAGGIYLPDGSQLDPAIIQGKTVLIHFWISGCKFCLEEHQRVMADLSERYQGSEDVLIMTVNGDANKENWKRSLATGKYASESSLNTWVPLNTGILQSYSVYSYPQKMIISKDGAIQLQSIVRMELQDLINRLEHASEYTTDVLSSTNQ
ncbi:TlpA disulfide reductase family protein [Algoriphagus sp. D3-2-R+10]|uniref:TlpA family protein disulfide reductase n=1 Tax=Algoriphagus aurantiacus TaxID=3103948 RepID=UPI002B37AD4E|nr:TlpA disulfide reductase family protein [Algoriphagus sp. D3-2-R+10]MEB2777325.1 TlpA disulfide reductase family protein [Algoriphagus sp. D3-2-R+10]